MHRSFRWHSRLKMKMILHSDEIQAPILPGFSGQGSLLLSPIDKNKSAISLGKSII